MPMQIPQFDNDQVQSVVNPTVRVEQSAPLENFGGGQAAAAVGDEVGKVTKETMQFYMEQKKAADNAIGQDVYAKLTSKKNQLIYDPKSGAMTRKGQDALSVTDDYGKQFNDYADQIGSSLSNDDQRAQFDHFKRQVGDELNGVLTKYSYGQSQELQDQQADTAMKTAQDDAVLNYQEPGKVSQALDLQTNLLTNALKQKGMTDDVITEKVKEAKSQTLSNVIDRMVVNGQDMQARSTYDSVKGDITAPDAIRLEKTLEAGTMRGESQRKADSITDDADTMSDALDSAREIQDPKLRDETLKRVKDYYADQTLAQKTDDDNRFNAASEILEKTKNLDSIPPQMMTNMSSAQKRNLEVRFTQLRDGIEPEANGETFYNLQQMAVTPDLRDKFLGANLLEYNHQVTKGELSNLMSIQASMRKSDGEQDDQIRGLRTKTQVVSQTLGGLGLDKDKSAVLEINRQVDDQISQQFPANSGKKPTGDDVQKILDNIVVKAKSNNAWNLFGSSSAYSFPKTDTLKVDVDNIPAFEKSQITRALNRAGIQVTDDKIEELYNRKLNQMRQNGQY